MTKSSPLSIFHPQRAKRSLTFIQKFVIAIAALITAPVLLVLIFLVATDDVESKISGPVTIGPEWMEIRPDNPLKVSRRTQSILLYVSDKHESYNELNDPSGRSWAMRFPDGSLVRPQVQLFDQYGIVYNLDAPSFLSKDRTSGELN